MNEDAEFAAPCDDLCHWLKGSDLMVSPLDVYERGGWFDRRQECIDVNASRAVDTDRRDPAPERSSELLGGATHSRVLHRTENDLRSAALFDGAADGSPRGGGDGLGRTTGEDDLSRTCAHETGDLLTSGLESNA
jgi:hypothetical protein